ncbi:hypothetical protein Efla_001295 [Eimeria flavescens]
MQQPQPLLAETDILSSGASSRSLLERIDAHLLPLEEAPELVARRRRQQPFKRTLFAAFPALAAVAAALFLLSLCAFRFAAADARASSRRLSEEKRPEEIPLFGLCSEGAAAAAAEEEAADNVGRLNTQQFNNGASSSSPSSSFPSSSPPSSSPFYPSSSSSFLPSARPSGVYPFPNIEGDEVSRLRAEANRRALQDLMKALLGCRRPHLRHLERSCPLSFGDIVLSVDVEELEGTEEGMS